MRVQVDQSRREAPKIQTTLTWTSSAIEPSTINGSTAIKLVNAKIAMLDKSRMAPIPAGRKENADMKDPFESKLIMAEAQMRIQTER